MGRKTEMTEGTDRSFHNSRASRSENFMQFRNVVRWILKLYSCERVGRGGPILIHFIFFFILLLHLRVLAETFSSLLSIQASHSSIMRPIDSNISSRRGSRSSRESYPTKFLKAPKWNNGCHTVWQSRLNHPIMWQKSKFFSVVSFLKLQKIPD